MSAAGSVFAFPVTPSQLQMLQYEADHPNAGSAYHITANYRLTGPVAPGLVAAAFDALVQRHEALRTVFRTIDGQPRQVVLPAAPSSLRSVDCRQDSALLDRELRSVAEPAFVFDTGPLIRGALLRSSDDQYLLAIVVHHLVSDGRSMAIMMHELTSDYAAGASGGRPIGERAGLQFADFTLWLAEAAPHDELLRQGRFWQRQLAGVPRDVDLPLDRPRSAVLDNLTDHHEFTVPAHVAARLRALARDSGETLYVLLLAITQILLSRRGAQELFVLGTNTERRGRPEFEDVFGYFVGRVPIKADLRGEPSLKTLLPRVRQATMDALANQDVLFDNDLAEPKPPWAPGVPAMSQVTFQLFHQGFTTCDTVAAGVRFEPVMGPTERIPKELMVLFTDDGELRCGLQWLVALFDRATIFDLCEKFITLLDAASRYPHQQIWRLPDVR
jgi:hypothetical protein